MPTVSAEDKVCHIQPAFLPLMFVSLPVHTDFKSVKPEEIAFGSVVMVIPIKVRGASLATSLPRSVVVRTECQK